MLVYFFCAGKWFWFLDNFSCWRSLKKLTLYFVDQIACVQIWKRCLLSIIGQIYSIVSICSIKVYDFSAYSTRICLSRSSPKSLLETGLSTAHYVLNSLVSSGLRQSRRRCDKSANAICINLKVSL